MNTFVSVLWFLLIFCVVVVSHELGHFLIAKANGIKVKEFYVGFGPTIIHWTKGDTKYSIKLLPLGGACVFEGMDGALEEEEKEGDIAKNAMAVAKGDDADVDEIASNNAMDASDDAEDLSVEIAEENDNKKGSFLEASPWSRLATVLAGPLFNIILGFIISFILVNLIAIREPVATQILEGSAAQIAGLQDGDRIVSMNKDKICLYDDILLFTAMHEGEDIFLVYERDGEKFSTILTPLYNEEYGRYMLGISNSSFVTLKGADALKYTWYEMRYNLKMTYGSLLMLVKGKVKSSDVSGPVGIAVNVVGQTYEQTKQYGISTVIINMMNIALMLTVNLGILNLLPIPALDGGRLLFIIIELLRGKPVPPKKEALVHFIGIIFFFILIILVFFNDIRNIFFH